MDLLLLGLAGVWSCHSFSVVLQGTMFSSLDSRRFGRSGFRSPSVFLADPRRLDRRGFLPEEDRTTLSGESAAPFAHREEEEDDDVW
jgi:hypothetical protein